MTGRRKRRLALARETVRLMKGNELDRAAAAVMGDQSVGFYCTYHCDDASRTTLYHDHCCYKPPPL